MVKVCSCVAQTHNIHTKTITELADDIMEIHQKTSGSFQQIYLLTRYENSWRQDLRIADLTCTPYELGRSLILKFL
jgi:hypothetical protein